jgi:hypothetical protein
MRAVVLAVVVVGCGGGHAAPDAAPVADSHAVDSASGDSDGDGVPDSVDNCPHDQNPNQHDEDGDGIGDACDLCPADAEPTNVDTDGDDIGDGCDPSPAPDEYDFDTFHPQQNLAWTAYGTWAIGADLDSYVQSSTTAAYADAIMTGPPAVDAGSIDTRFHLPVPAAATFDVGIEFRVSQADPATGVTGYTASLARTASGTVFRVSAHVAGVATVLMSTPITAALDGSAVHLRTVVTATQAVATLTLAGADHTLTVPTSTTGITTGAFGLMTANSSATFDDAYVTWPD